MVSRENRVLLVTTPLAFLAAVLVSVYGPTPYSTFLGALAFGGRTETLHTVFGAAITERLLVVGLATGLVVGLLAHDLRAGFRQGVERSDGSA